MTRYTLRVILPLIIFITFILVTTLSYMTSRYHIIKQTEERAINELYNKLNYTQGNLEKFLSLNSYSGARHVISALSSDLDIIDVFLTNKKGEILAATHYEYEGKNWIDLSLNLNPQVIEKVISKHNSYVEVNKEGGVLDGYSSICHYKSYNLVRQPSCGFLFYRASLKRPKDHALESLLSETKIDIISTIFITGFLLISLFHMINNRMSIIIKSLNAFSSGNRCQRINLSGKDELSFISQNINELLDRLVKEETLLKQSEQFQKAIIDSADFTIISTDQKGIIKSFNRVAEKKLGYRPYEVIDKQTPEILHDKKEVEQRALKLSSELNKTIEPGFKVFVEKARLGIPDKNEWTYITKSGDRIPFMLTVTALYNEQNIICGFLGIGEDISQRLKDEQQLLLYDKVFTNIGEPILITDKNNKIIDVNPAYVELTGFTKDEVKGKNPNVSQSGHHAKEFYKTMWEQIQTTGTWSGEIWDRKKSGEVYPTWLTINTVKDKHGEIANYVGIIKDVTVQKENEARLENLAYFDPLTHLPNRQLFHDRLQQAIKTAKRENHPFALLYIDLDHFKQVNDTLGHDAGDDLLIQVSERLNSCVRASDTIGRVGGDEFNAILLAIDRKDISMVASHMVKELEKEFNLRGDTANIGASIGIAIYPDDSEDLEKLNKKADIAMYHAKKQGRGNFQFYQDDMNQ